MREKVARAAGRMRGVYAVLAGERLVRLAGDELKILRSHPSSVGSADTFSRKGRRISFSQLFAKITFLKIGYIWLDHLRPLNTP